MTSVWSYRDLADFRQFIRNLVNRSMSMSHALAEFREVSMLPKRLGQLTVEEVSTKTELIEQIYRALKKMRPETTYKLPYDKKEREKEIIDNIAESFVIDKKNAHCKILTGYHRDGERQFPYAIEMALAPLKYSDVSRAGYVKFIGSVNDTPAIDGGEKYFQSDQYAYRWIDKKGEHEVRSAMDVLTSSGFNPTSPYTSRKRFASVAYVNVKTDVPDWLGAAGKTHMNQLPYAATIAKTLVTMAHKIPSYHGQGFALDPTPSSTTNQKTATEYVSEFLIQRRKDVEADPNLRITDRLTQRGVAYRLRPEMMADRFEPRIRWSTTMDSITNMISERCKMLWPDENIDREYLGIYAKARGMFYYRGRTTPIDFNAIGELASKAAVNIVIEKEGVPAVLAPYADKYRVALISTQGRFVDYVKRFVSSVIDEAAVVVTILDDDRVGREMAKSTRAINIGVNKDTVEWLRKNGYPSLSVEKVQERDPSTGEYRIEIDSILAEVGAEGLWKWIKYEIEKLAPLDVRKSIDMPANELLYAKEIADSFTYMNDYADLVTSHTREEIKKELSESDELYDVGAKEAAIEEELSSKLADDEGMKMLAEELPKIIRKLKEFVEKKQDL
jgi:hypothetical protein